MTLAVEPATLGAFALAAAAIVVSPGPDTLVILRSALASGARAGLAAVLGVQLGLLVHTVLAAVGITAVIASSPTLFTMIAVAGAAYLAWLGWQGLRATGRLALAGSGQALPPAVCLRHAMLTNVLNPKVIVLFFALYPNFIAIGHGRITAQLTVLSTALIAINVAWQAGLVWFADRARHWLANATAQMWISRGTGAILIAFAAAMLINHAW
ncbi:MAG: LysE family transporter [Rhodospirillales bacterium]|nr:LysE family transporter [Rhodospirillales bacterium]